EITPSTACPSLLTTAAPMRRSRSRSHRAPTVSVGRIVTTADTLAARMLATFTAAPPATLTRPPRLHRGEPSVWAERLARQPILRPCSALSRARSEGARVVALVIHT